MWSSGEEHVRVMAFVGLTKLLRLISTTLVDFAIKVSCKYTNLKLTIVCDPLLSNMDNSKPVCL